MIISIIATLTAVSLYVVSGSVLAEVWGKAVLR